LNNKTGRKKFFFCKKRTKKTFAPLRACAARTARPDDGAALAAPLRNSELDKSESGRANLRVLSFFASFCSQKAVLSCFINVTAQRL
jgi:hypothetical protein